MDFSLSPEETRFRDGLRAWLREHLPSERGGHGQITGDVQTLEDRRRWQRAVYDAGYAGVAWPVEYGGRGGTPMQQMIVNEEMAAAKAPDLINIIGLFMAGPTILAHGTEDQKTRYLRPLLSGDEIWCQGFSEPNSGSDLASLRTKALVDGDDFVINGQKVWTTLAHVAKWCILLTRTKTADVAHTGLTYVIVDMRSPGVEVKPLRQLTGDAEFNEIYFTDVRVPRVNVLGKIGDGWRVAMTTLMHERASLGVGLQVRSRIALDDLRRLFREDSRLETSNGQSRSEPPPCARATRDDRRDAILRQKIAQLVIEVEAMKLNGYRGLTQLLKGQEPGPEGSINKLMWSEVNQRIQETALEVIGPYGTLAEGEVRAPQSGRWTYAFLRARANSIEGGTSEVLRNILAERVLGLPRSR